MKQSLKFLAVINIVFGIGLLIFIYLMLPFAHGVITDAVAQNGTEYPLLKNRILILSSVTPAIIILLNTIIALSIRNQYEKLSLYMLSFFPAIITLYVVIQLAISFFA